MPRHQGNKEIEETRQLPLVRDHVTRRGDRIRIIPREHPPFGIAPAIGILRNYLQRTTSTDDIIRAGQSDCRTAARLAPCVDRDHPPST